GSFAAAAELRVVSSPQGIDPAPVDGISVSAAALEFAVVSFAATDGLEVLPQPARVSATKAADTISRSLIPSPRARSKTITRRLTVGPYGAMRRLLALCVVGGVLAATGCQRASSATTEAGSGPLVVVSAPITT